MTVEGADLCEFLRPKNGSPPPDPALATLLDSRDFFIALRAIQTIKQIKTNAPMDPTEIRTLSAVGSIPP